MKQILCMSSEPWSNKLPGRTQQIVSRLRDTQILYFFPAQSPRGKTYLKGGRQVRPNVTAYELPAIPFPIPERYHMLFQMAWKKVGRFIQDTAARHRFRQPLLWTTHPRHIHLVDQLEYSALIYDCDRSWEGLPPHWEGSLAQAADVVFAASSLLADRLSPCSANIALLPNGINLPLFQPHTVRPDPMPGVTAPILGWAGTIRAGLDLSPVLYAAQACPDWGFLLIGAVDPDNPFLRRLDKLSNVYLTGPRPATEVPDWLYRCQVLMDLQRTDQPFDDVISPRLYEYLATGRPVVSMLWPDQVETFPDVVYGAHDLEEFVTLCAHAMEEAPGFVSQRRMDRAAEAAWPQRVGEVERILTTAGLLG
ncbi:MAG: glycosyltransferase family 1 protein [Lawsonibacter sp.]|nr:glycosyltransferase family 1 protein [Lawsonibacter sp.]